MRPQIRDVFLRALEGLFIDRMEQNEEITAKYLNEKDFQEVVGQKLLNQVYEQIHKDNQPQANGSGV